MSHNLVRFSSLVFNQPQLITEKAFRPIVSYLLNRNSGLSETIYQGTPGPGLQTEEMDIFNGVGVLKINGVLTYKPTWMMCQESTSYMELLEEVQEMCEAGVKAIIFEVASGGGAASHMMSTANDIRKLLDEYGVASYAYIDELSASAAYGISCVCDELVIHPDAMAGSIGAMIALMDDSKAMDEAGLKEIYITSTPGKVPFDSNGKFKESFLQRLQNEVSKLGNQFCEHVSKHIGVSAEEIKALDAQVFDAEESLQKGLVNAIMDHQEFTNYISSKYK